MTVTHMHQKRHRLRKLRGETAYIAVDAARLHLATLMGAGWSLRSIAGASGVASSTLSQIIRGNQNTASPDTIARVVAVRPNTVPDRTDGKEGAEPFVSRVGTTRRIQALLFMGWGHKQMREHSGVPTACVVHQQGRWVTRSTHDAVAAMYRDLSDRRGPSSKATTYATRLGYAGPADWDDIDHDVEPSRETEDDAPAHTLSEYRHLISCGVAHEQACLQLGVTSDAIEAAIARETAQQPPVSDTSDITTERE